MNPFFKEIPEALPILQALFEGAVDGIILINCKGIIQAINPAAARLFDCTPKEVIGDTVNNLMPAPHHTRHDGYLERYHRTDEKRIIGIGREVEGKRKDGTVFPFFLSVTEVRLAGFKKEDENGHFYAGFVHDLSDQKKVEAAVLKLNEKLEQKVTERTEQLSEVVNKLLETNKQLEYEIDIREKTEEALKQSEQEIRQAYEKEKELNELKSRFVSMASHEFRTPLSTILSSSALLSRYTQTEQQEKRDKHINRIKSSVNNLTGILNDFLSLSKLEEGKVSYEPSLISWNSFCIEVIDEMQGLLKKGQALEHTEGVTVGKIYLDARLLKNILYNLLSNAIKYSPEESTIYCRSTRENGYLVLEVEDQGIGIPEADQQHLFTRFFRAANAINIQGTGLGLNIVNQYVKLMNGEVSFKSIEGEGTTFKIKIPIT